MSQPTLVTALESQKKMFLKSTSVLKEADSGFTPQDGLFTVAQHVAHVAYSIDWFVEGAFERPDGPDPDFEAFDAKARAVTSLDEARTWLDRAVAHAIEVISSRSDAELDEPFTGEILGGIPKRSLVELNGDHMAHHRGALTVYTRMLGKEPPMPYA